MGQGKKTNRESGGVGKGVGVDVGRGVAVGSCAGVIKYGAGGTGAWRRACAMATGSVHPASTCAARSQTAQSATQRPMRRPSG